MRVNYSWLKDFVDIKVPAQVLAHKLTMAGLEVVALEPKDGDIVFEIEITSNRPDWLSVIGVAREVAAVTGVKCRACSVERRAYSKSNLSAKRYPLNAKTFKIDIESKKDCPLYTAKVIRNVKVGPSPEWLKKRLESVGIRSINNVVDITNYVMLECGEPLHAFDLDKLSGNSVIVRRAMKDEPLTTIDAVERRLNENILVIADAKKAVAVAGVMGGKDTQVSSLTRNVLLEAAVFDPVLIRKGRRQMGLQSESSYRFERGVDKQTALSASLRALELIKDLAAGVCVYAGEVSAPAQARKSVALSVSRTQDILGVKIQAAKIKSILTALGFKVTPKNKNSFNVSAPSHRQDIAIEEDLIEEVARIYGYENIPTTQPKVLPNPTLWEARDLIANLKNNLTGLGLSEAVTYSLTDNNSLQAIPKLKDAPTLGIQNPLSIEQEVLRTTVIPGLLKSIALNLNQKQENIALFETAKIFYAAAAAPQEEMSLGVVLCGPKYTLLHLKGIAENIFERLKVSKYEFKPSASTGEIFIGQEKTGYFYNVPQQALQNAGIKNKEAFAMEILLDKAFAKINLHRKFTPLPKFPGITRDISVIIKDGVSIDDIFSAIRASAGGLLEEVRVIDFYQGTQIPEGHRSLTISCLYRSAERTLTDGEVNPWHERACAGLTERFQARIR